MLRTVRKKEGREGGERAGRWEGGKEGSSSIKERQMGKASSFRK